MSFENKNDIIEQDDIDSDFEGEVMPTSGSPGSDIDDILTDDLLASSEEEIKNKKRQSKKTLTKKKTPVKRARKTTQTKLKLPQGPETWNPTEVKELSEKYPDKYWKHHADSGSNMIQMINKDHQLETLPTDMSDQSAIASMTLSEDGGLLATFSSIGSVKIFEIGDNVDELRKIRDEDEPQIDEFFCGTFTPNGLLAVGGKIKDRQRWSTEDNDNHIMPCDIKIFDMVASKVLARLVGHAEEVLTIKAIQFKENNYLISTSQDGSILKWHMADDWSTLISKTKMEDNFTCMAFTVSFLPNTGNKYFLAATDEHVRLFDFETGKLLQTFRDLYTSYCDCVKFVKWVDEAAYFKNNGMDINHKPEDGYAWFITRGTELCDVSEFISSKPNVCTLHKLTYPTKKNGEFKVEEIMKYTHPEYRANSWSVKISSNGRYILAPTIYGQVYVFNMLTGKVAAIIKEHGDIEVRDVIFHPSKPLLFSCSDDGYVKVYTYKPTVKVDIEQDLDIGTVESATITNEEAMDVEVVIDATDI
ncbi:WD40-repeat-containing domain protein [Mucor mucedo]|uniref:WD40-repeat-containing domain protein n=1 Tax=Mucor mucedo TaxID=29922 RepID=UPI00221E4559|nr:WD40-repeat-containing domain protein [Mucor mucedo]KAI7887958.1 WD40-repeat-containing domain protein [Mucor mucedo]